MKSILQGYKAAGTVAAILLLMAFSKEGSAQQSRYRGVYVDKLHDILKDTIAENRFLSWAKHQHIEQLSCYDLYTVLGDRSIKKKLIPFMQKAKHRYGIQRFDVVASSAAYLIAEVYPFNLESISHGVHFSAFHIEREWWTKNVTFNSHSANLKRMRNFLTDSSRIPGIKLETYIGWLGLGKEKKQKEAGVLIRYADMIGVSAYQKVPSFAYLKSRIEELAIAAHNQGKMQDIVILFSMEPAFSGPYSSTRSYDAMYDQVISEMQSAIAVHDINPLVLSNIRFLGWKVFAQSYARRYRP